MSAAAALHDELDRLGLKAIEDGDPLLIGRCFGLQQRLARLTGRPFEGPGAIRRLPPYAVALRRQGLRLVVDDTASPPEGGS
jgi:hypothetical protein